MNPFAIFVGKTKPQEKEVLEIFSQEGDKIGEYCDRKDHDKPYHIIKEVIQE